MVNVLQDDPDHADDGDDERPKGQCACVVSVERGKLGVLESKDHENRGVLVNSFIGNGR